MNRSRRPQRAPAADRIVDGVCFDSKAEARRWCELSLLQQAGEITELRRQVAFPLVIDGRPVMTRSDRYKKGRAAKYTADFTYWENGKYVVEENKGVWTEAARLRIAIVEAILNLEVRVTGAAVMRRKKNAG